MAILKNVTINDTGSITLPSGTTAHRPVSPVNGDMRFNTTLGYVEYYYNGFWADARTNYGAFDKTNAILILDADLATSYPGSGTVWYDISGNGNNFNVLASAFNSSGKYFDFNGSYGMAKNSSDLSLTGEVTYMTVTRVKQSNAEWRTLTRGYNGDHHIIIAAGGWEIGIYDNDGSGFISTGYSQQLLPCYRNLPDGGRSWEVLAWVWSNADNPTYSLYSNGVLVGTITNSNARYTRGFGSIGGYHGGTSDTGSGNSQHWGDIKFFAAFNRRLGKDEIIQNTNALRLRFGI